MAYLKGQLPVIQSVDPVTGVGLISDNDLVLVVLQVARCFFFVCQPEMSVKEKQICRLQISKLIKGSSKSSSSV